MAHRRASSPLGAAVRAARATPRLSVTKGTGTRTQSAGAAVKSRSWVGVQARPSASLRHSTSGARSAVPLGSRRSQKASVASRIMVG
ncbi:MAG: hypothetical protein IPI49_00020 [Myxococcales bacterium]|nr:hypothetical protein [Myxococcales bacterium]